MPTKTTVTLETVSADDGEVRLDRWLKRHYPQLTQGQIQKLLRTKQIKVDGKKAEANQRVSEGCIIRVPPLPDHGSPMINAKERRDNVFVSDADAKFVQSLVIYKDKDVIVLNKPAGLAVQGGTGQTKHLDGMLSALRFEKEENPRLVHRLDKDTSGVLVLGRTPSATAFLADAFKSRDAKKIYWALVYGNPDIKEGKISAKLLKCSGEFGGELMRVDEKNGQSAITLYRVEDEAYKKASWLELMPLTGRTHQLRAHCLVMGHPIIGDGKYKIDGKNADYLKYGNKLHLHARALKMPLPNGKMLEVYAPLCDEMKDSFDFFGFDYKNAKNPFKKFPIVE
ncbi:MAG: RluA family pseudouridine synthase [Alphaproteobacteria bacterium]|nr:RluA family pseudouridine synthase [Alphaproteobacteria bacterium]